MTRPAVALQFGWFAIAALCGAQERPTFKAESRLVEVYATVLDQRGRYVDDLSRSAFRILDNGAPQNIVSFENSATQVSCAILLDTTGSMAAALPKVKSAIYKLIDQFRDGDLVAIYTFSSALDKAQDFTADRSAAKRAVARTRAEGATALFDAVSRVALDVSERKGKKAIVVFTDGDDNASVLNARRATDRAKKLGIPVYTVAEGGALRQTALLNLLKDVARVTGGKSYVPKNLNAVAGIFDDIAEELRHTYWLSYQAPPATDSNWRRIDVQLNSAAAEKVHAKEGYLPN